MIGLQCTQHSFITKLETQLEYISVGGGGRDLRYYFIATCQRQTLQTKICNAFNKKSNRILPITAFKRKLETSYLKFSIIHVQGYTIKYKRVIELNQTKVVATL